MKDCALFGLFINMIFTTINVLFYSIRFFYLCDQSSLKMINNLFSMFFVSCFLLGVVLIW